MKLKIKKDLKTPFGLKKANEIIEINDDSGVPTDRFWRNRLRDAAIDDCVQIIIENEKKSK